MQQLSDLVGPNTREAYVIMDQLRNLYPEKFNESGAMDYKWFEAEIRPTKHIYVRNDVNSLSFTIQKGPIKEVGKNGCQIVDVLQFCKNMLETLNKTHPCRENAITITKLDEAIMWQDKRTADRTAREVEGTNAV